MLVPVLDKMGSVSHLIDTRRRMTVAFSEQAVHLPEQDTAPDMAHFVALAAHDLRTAMRNIRTLTEVLRKAFQDHGDGKTALTDLLEDVAAKSGCPIAEVLDYPNP